MTNCRTEFLKVRQKTVPVIIRKSKTISLGNRSGNKTATN
jgi:hypothetical protein